MLVHQHHQNLRRQCSGQQQMVSQKQRWQSWLLQQQMAAVELLPALLLPSALQHAQGWIGDPSSW